MGSETQGVAGLNVCVAYSPAAGIVDEVLLELAEGATVGDALQASALMQRYPELGEVELNVGVWGRRCGLEQGVRDQDRVEVYRGLRVDPKVARRERFARQGARNAGLFAKRRDGAKAGY